MGTDELLALLLRAARLKWVVRSGWAMHGVPDPESVAEHAWGVTVVALVLAEGAQIPLDREKLLTIALLHDLPEAVLSDIPSPALRYLDPQAKRGAEEEALAEMVSPLAGAERLLSWWREFEDGSTPEGRLVRDADRLEMLVQAHLYEENRSGALDEFWKGQDERPFYFPVAQELYAALLARRRREDGDQ